MTATRAKRLRARSKVWLEAGGEPVFGDGKQMLLEAVDRTGSLRAAAEELGMSYRGLWGRLRQMERRLGVQLVRRRVGGRGGGGAALTPEAADLIARYRRFRRGIDTLVDARFAKAFGQG